MKLKPPMEWIKLSCHANPSNAFMDECKAKNSKFYWILFAALEQRKSELQRLMPLVDDFNARVTLEQKKTPQKEWDRRLSYLFREFETETGVALTWSMRGAARTYGVKLKPSRCARSRFEYKPIGRSGTAHRAHSWQAAARSSPWRNPR